MVMDTYSINNFHISGERSILTLGFLCYMRDTVETKKTMYVNI